LKRTFKRPDGTEETLEGTAEELAEYERKLREPEQRPARPGVLKGKGLEELLREMRALPDRVAERLPRPWITQPYPYPIWVVSCPTCGRIDCNGYHAWPIGFTITLDGSAAARLLAEQPQAPGYGLNLLDPLTNATINPFGQCLDSKDS